MKRFTLALLGLTALSLLAPGTARAAAFLIDDTRTDENILFSANDFEGGMMIDGSLMQSGLNNPNSVLLPEADSTGHAIRHDFLGRWITTGAQLPGPIQVAFLEPSTTRQIIISDILFAQYGQDPIGGTVTGYFISDASETGLDQSLLVAGIPVTSWPETNGAFDFSAPFLTARAVSDVEVPEAASILILGVGACVGALVPLRRRSRA